MPYNSVSKIALDICEATGATPRQMDYWARLGVFGDEFIGRGSGSPRPWWKPGIVDAVDACVQLSALGAGTPVLAMVADVISARPVVDGEWLIVSQDGARRHDHFCFDDRALREPSWVIPLRSLAATPAGSDEGVAVTAAAASTSSP